jgi:hypothetical protein
MESVRCCGVSGVSLGSEASGVESLTPNARGEVSGIADLFGVTNEGEDDFEGG